MIYIRLTWQRSVGFASAIPVCFIARYQLFGTQAFAQLNTTNKDYRPITIARFTNDVGSFFLLYTSIVAVYV